MSRTPRSMREVREILRLKHEAKLSIREIARSCGMPRATVSDYLNRAKVAGLSWAKVQELGDEELEARLLAVEQAESSTSEEDPPLPDWSKVRKELGRKGVTLRLVWQEYIKENPNGYKYSRFCELYRQWANTLEPTMRQTHPPGEKAFVDWAGQTIPIEAGQKAEGLTAHLFVAVLGASNKIYAEAFSDQTLESWITAHCHAYEFFGGAPRVTVPDNPKTAVVKACRYEPQLHRSYKEMAQHYGTVIVPARPRRPKDKAKVESHVLIASRQILAPIRDRQFFSLAELNQAVRKRVSEINAQPFQKLEGSRDSLFESEEKHHLLALPRERYSLAYWIKAKVNIDHHVVVDKHFYSVDHSLIGEHVEARLDRNVVEIFHNGKRVAIHARSHLKGRHTTLEEHRPKAHQRYNQWRPSRIIGWARRDVGPVCGRLVKAILNSRPHPEQGYRACMGIIRLAQSVGTARMEAACRRALRYELYSYQSLKSILKNRLDQEFMDESGETNSIDHSNIRGADYYE